MAELLHAGAWAATALSTCCVAASGRRLRVRDGILALAMLVAMSDVVFGVGLLPPVGWAGVLLIVTLLAVTVAPGARARSSGARENLAMDALGAVLMAALFALMPGNAHASDGGHGSHGLSASALIWVAVVASAAFAAASVHMAVKMRMPHPATPVRVRVLRRSAPLAMGASVILMAAVTLA